MKRLFDIPETKIGFLNNVLMVMVKKGVVSLEDTLENLRYQWNAARRSRMAFIKVMLDLGLIQSDDNHKWFFPCRDALPIINILSGDTSQDKKKALFVILYRHPFFRLQAQTKTTMYLVKSFSTHSQKIEIEKILRETPHFSNQIAWIIEASQCDEIIDEMAIGKLRNKLLKELINFTACDVNYTGCLDKWEGDNLGIWTPDKWRAFKLWSSYFKTIPSKPIFFRTDWLKNSNNNRQAKLISNLIFNLALANMTNKTVSLRDLDDSLQKEEEVQKMLWHLRLFAIPVASTSKEMIPLHPITFYEDQDVERSPALMDTNSFLIEEETIYTNSSVINKSQQASLTVLKEPFVLDLLHRLNWYQSGEKIPRQYEQDTPLFLSAPYDSTGSIPFAYGLFALEISNYSPFFQEVSNFPFLFIFTFLAIETDQKSPFCIVRLSWEKHRFILRHIHTNQVIDFFDLATQLLETLGYFVLPFDEKKKENMFSYIDNSIYLDRNSLVMDKLWKDMTQPRNSSWHFDIYKKFQAPLNKLIGGLYGS